MTIELNTEEKICSVHLQSPEETVDNAKEQAHLLIQFFKLTGSVKITIYDIDGIIVYEEVYQDIGV